MTNERAVILPFVPLHLAGSLRLPGAGLPCPAVLLIPGSGQVDRDENAPRAHINALHDIAVALSDQGIASLRFDKRGVGASAGDYWETGFFDHVTDAAAALGFLQAQPEVRPDKLFVLGHSEGSLIATRLAGTGSQVAGVILLAGPAQTGEQVLLWQAAQVLKGMRGLNKWLIDLFHIDTRKAQKNQLDRIKRSTRNSIRIQLVAKLNAKWFREFMAYDPAEDLPKIQAPILAITGTKDIQVDPADLDRIAALVRTEFESHLVPNLTHLLRSEPGQPSLSTYKRQIAQPLDSRVLQLISEWLARQISL
ncbi:MAG: alpha/beta fold hydrolase [Anaerolineales bacterium]|jgi:alpha-beta hydrolase superfamily lysophospholipase